MPAVHKNSETGGLAVDLFDDDPDNFIEVIVTVQTLRFIRISYMTKKEACIA